MKNTLLVAFIATALICIVGCCGNKARVSAGVTTSRAVPVYAPSAPLLPPPPPPYAYATLEK